MEKKIFKCLLLLFLVLLPVKSLALSKNYEDLLYKVLDEKVEEEKINVYFFYGDGCPHCAKEEEFLEEVKNDYGDNVNIFYYETWNNVDNKNKMLTVKSLLQRPENVSVPFTVVGKESYVGYNDYVGEKIELKIREYLDLVTNNEVITEKDKEDIPLLGRVDAKEVSIGLVAVILGLVDGFNPCAMWVLLFLINMLFGMKNKKRMLLLGIVFLFTSGFVYFLSMLGITAIFSVISVPMIRSVIGVVALVVGLFNIKKYLDTRKDEAGCHVVDEKKRKKIFTRIKKFTTEKNLWLALLGVIVLAVSVNLVELACSTVFPATFAEILAINNVTGFTRILYLIIYTIFYMLDDMVVFIIAVATLNITTASTKVGKYSSLIGGIIMLLMGILLIFKPEWVMFNF